MCDGPALGIGPGSYALLPGLTGRYPGHSPGTVDRLTSAAAQSAKLSSIGEMVTPTATPEEPKHLVEQHACDRSRQDDNDKWRVDIPGEEVNADIFGVLERDDNGQDSHSQAEHQGHADTGSPEDGGDLATSLRRGHDCVRLVRRGERVADTLAGPAFGHETRLSAAATAPSVVPAPAGPAQAIEEGLHGRVWRRATR